MPLYSKKFKITAYYSVPRDIYTIKQALCQFGPIVRGTKWQNSWFNPINGVLPKPDSDGGGHAILIGAYDDNKETQEGKGAALLINSWGNSWADNGKVWIPYEYLSKYMVVGYKAVDFVDGQIVTRPRRT